MEPYNQSPSLSLGPAVSNSMEDDIGVSADTWHGEFLHSEPHNENDSYRIQSPNDTSCNFHVLAEVHELLNKIPAASSSSSSTYTSSTSSPTPSSPADMATAAANATKFSNNRGALEKAFKEYEADWIPFYDSYQVALIMTREKFTPGRNAMHDKAGQKNNALRKDAQPNQSVALSTDKEKHGSRSLRPWRLLIPSLAASPEKNCSIALVTKKDGSMSNQGYVFNKFIGENSYSSKKIDMAQRSSCSVTLDRGLAEFWMIFFHTGNATITIQVESDEPLVFTVPFQLEQDQVAMPVDSASIFAELEPQLLDWAKERCEGRFTRARVVEKDMGRESEIELILKIPNAPKSDVEIRWPPARERVEKAQEVHFLPVKDDTRVCVQSPLPELEKFIVSLVSSFHSWSVTDYPTLVFLPELKVGGIFNAIKFCVRNSVQLKGAAERRQGSPGSDDDPPLRASASGGAPVGSVQWLLSGNHTFRRVLMYLLCAKNPFHCLAACGDYSIPRLVAKLRGTTGILSPDSNGFTAVQIAEQYENFPMVTLLHSMISEAATVFDERLSVYNGDGCIRAFGKSFDLVHGKCEIKHSVTTSAEVEVEFEGEESQLARIMPIERVSRPASRIQVRSMSCKNGSDVKLKVEFIDDDHEVVDCPRSRPQFRLRGPAALVGRTGKKLEIIPHQLSVNKESCELKCGPFTVPAGKYTLEISASDGDGNDFRTEIFDIEVTPGKPHGLVIEPGTIGPLRSGEVFPDLTFSLLDSSNNLIQLHNEKINIEFADEDKVRFDPVWDEEDPYHPVLQKRSIWCIRSGKVMLSASLAANPAIRTVLGVEVQRGAAPNTLHAHFEESQASSLNVHAGNSTQLAMINVFVDDEEENEFPFDDYTIKVTGVLPPDGRRVVGTCENPFSLQVPTFTVAGTYRIEVSMHSDWGNLGPILREVIVHPAQADDARFVAPKWATLDEPFQGQINFIDAFGNPVHVLDLVLHTSIDGLAIEQTFKGTTSYQVTPHVHSSFTFSMEEGQLQPGSYDVTLTCPGLPKFSHTLTLIVPKSTTQIVRQPQKKRPAAPLPDNSAQIRDIETSIRLLESEIRKLRDLFGKLRDQQEVWPQNYIERSFARHPTLVALPMANLCMFILTDQFLKEIEQRPNPSAFLDTIRKNVSKHLFFLRSIALDMPNKTRNEFFATSKATLAKLPQEQGRSKTYKFVHLSASRKIESSENVQKPRLEQLVRPDPSLSNELQTRIMAAINSFIMKKCAVFLSERDINATEAGHDPQLCLETGELRSVVGENATAEFQVGQYMGPLIRVSSSPKYAERLEARLKEKEKTAEAQRNRVAKLQEEQAPQSKRQKKN